MTNYEGKFVELYKEADFLGRGEERVKLSDKDWQKRCDKLAEAFKKIPKDIDEDIEKLKKTKFLFERREKTRCDMVAYYIEDDCKLKPKECPAEIKKIIINKLKEEIKDYESMNVPAERTKKELEKLENG